PLYEFGYGKSYTSFSYSDLSVSKTGTESVHLSFNLTNTGDYDGDEVVQVYVRDEKASTVRPGRQLCAFRRINVPKGQTLKVEFDLGSEAFRMYDASMNRIVEKGDFTLMVGASSKDIRLEDTITL
ncbi:MAG: fibronectin type III-like domain-contianing protein, partial [Bacteroidales bacterium]|nr:fibronectin type III-like domain-contianing protein [Bacteroidales bacterium]